MLRVLGSLGQEDCEFKGVQGYFLGRPYLKKGKSERITA